MFAQEVMMDIKKEREEFEQLPAVAKLIKTNDVWWSDVHGDYFGSDHELDCWIDGAWAVWQAKSQAVPEGFVLVPHDVADRCMSHITLAMCHPNNTNAENDVMQMDLDILESRVEAQEQSHD